MNNIKKSDNTIDGLLAVDPSTVSAPALKLALEQHRKEQEEKAAREALQYLRNVEMYVSNSVEQLRQARRVEREAKERLEKVVAARDDFHKTGNWSEFNKAIRNL